MTKSFVVGVAMVLLCGWASAQDAAAPQSCQAVAAQKKLAGAAKNSFLTKCEKDAKAVCEGRSKEKKLAGAAKNSFEKKCLKDAVGN